jgi:hypothetical protein
VNAYVQFKRDNKDFYAEAFAKGVKTDQGTNSFETVLRRAGTRDGAKGLKKTLEDGKAMYLYGGRKALVREFAAFRATAGDFVLTPASGKKLAVFHGKVDASGKTKRILMIANTSGPTTPPPSALNDRRLKEVNLGDWYQTPGPGQGNWGYYNRLDLRGLDLIVRGIPD